jgi:hypothetical protein
MYNNVITERELDGFLFLQNGSQIIYNSTKILNLKNKKQIDLLNIAVYRFFDKILVCKDFQGNKIILDSELEIVKEFNSGKDSFISEFFENSFLHNYYKNQNYDLPFIGIFDIETQSNVWEVQTSFQNYLIHDDMIFISGIDLKVKLYYSNSEKSKWHFDIPTIPNNPQDDEYDKTADWEVKKFIGVLENKLWVALNHHTIIALDIKTGKLVHQIHDVPTFKSEWLPSAVPHSEATVIDEKSNKLIGFMWEFYWEINPQNGEITLFDLTEDFQSQKVRNDLQDFVLTDSHIYFASHHDIKVASFNRQTKQIDWFHEFKDNGIGYQSRISKIDGNDEKLGVLTQENILYIFEKE